MALFERTAAKASERGARPAQKIIVAVVHYATGANRAPSWGVDRWFLNERCGVPEHNRKQEEGYTMVRQGKCSVVG